MENREKKRITWIDIARAFAIILIVLGHTLIHSAHCKLIVKFIYSFHVVLFFIISGYTFKIQNKESFLDFSKKKFLRIMIPYFIWATLFLIPYMLFGNKVGETLNTTQSFNLKNQLINILYGNGVNSALKQNSSLWFLPALFSMEILYYFIIKMINKRKKLEIPILLLVIIISYITNIALKIQLPWGINTSLVGGVFFYIGYLLKNKNLLIKDSILLKPVNMIIVFILGTIACFKNKEIVSFIDYKYGFLTLALISGICLSIFVIYISIILNKNKVLEYIGKNTIGILIFHKLIILLFQAKMGIISKMLKDSNVLIELTLSLLIVIISIIFSLIITKIIRKIFPILIGEKKNIVKRKDILVK